jgi:integrase/recombinase XerD
MDPGESTSVLRFPREQASKSKDTVKYLTGDQLAAVLAEVDKLPRMPDYNKERLKALILVMRWTGLRASDAVVLKAESITGDVLRLRTKKASTDVQVPLHPDLTAALAKLTPHHGGYYFWDRRSNTSRPATVQGNYGKLMAQVFGAAGVDCDQHHVAHMLWNSFAVYLLENDVPLETVSLMLGHQLVTTTERYYADFSKGYMDKAEARVRAVWTISNPGLEGRS